jgi:hypothetical protein
MRKFAGILGGIMACAAFANLSVAQPRNIVDERLVANQAAQISYAPLTLPTALGAPRAVYSVIRLAGWPGKCLQARRDSDNATLVIGFTANNVCDFPTADQWAGAANLYVVTWYDQSGNGNDISQTNATLQPTFSRGNEWGSVRPVSIFSTLIQTPQLTIGGALSGSMTANNLSVYTVMVPRINQSEALYWQACPSHPCAATSTNMYTHGAMTFGFSPAWNTKNVPVTPAIMGVYGYSAASAVIGTSATFRGSVTSAGILNVSSVTTGTITVGSAISGYPGLYVLSPANGAGLTPGTGGAGDYNVTSGTTITSRTLVTQGVAQVARLLGVENITATLPGAATVGAFYLGSNYTGSTWPGLADYYAAIVYPSSHTSAQMQTVEAPLNSSFQTVQLSAYTKNLQYNGSSLITSNFATNGQQIAFQEGFGRDASHSNVAAWRMVVTAVGGRTLASEAAAGAGPGWFHQYLPASSYPTITKNVYVMDAPSNDIYSANGQPFALETACTSSCAPSNYGGLGTAASFNGAVTSGGLLTASSVTGVITVGSLIYGPGQVSTFLTILSFGTGTGHAGTYNVTSGTAIAGKTMTTTGAASHANAVAWADSVYKNITIPFVTALQSTGWNVVVPTIIARGAYLTGPGSNYAEDARLSYNAQVIAGAAAHGYIASDRTHAGGLASIFNQPGTSGCNCGAWNPTYFHNDAAHLTNLGYGLVGAVDKAAILSY